MTNQTLRKVLLVAAGSVITIALPAMGIAQENTQAPQQDQQQTAPPSDNQQAHGKHGMKHGEGFKKLNLTDDQKAQMKKIREDARAQADSIRNDSSLNADAKNAKLKDLHKSSMKQMHALLTPDQKKQLKENRKERRAEKSQTQPS